MNVDSLIASMKANPWLIGGGVLVAIGAFYWFNSAGTASADTGADGGGYVSYGGFASPTLYGAPATNTGGDTGGGLDMTALLGLQSDQAEYDYNLGMAGIDAQNRLTANNLEIARLNSQATMFGIQANLYNNIASRPDQYNVGTIQFDPNTNSMTVNTLNINSRWLGETNVQAFTRHIWNVTNATQSTAQSNGTVPLPAGVYGAEAAAGNGAGANPYAPTVYASNGGQSSASSSSSSSSGSSGRGVDSAVASLD